MTSNAQRPPLQDSRSAALAAEEQDLLRRHPLGRSAIFLPTEKVPLEQRVIGLRRVVELYEGGFRDRHLNRLRALRQRFAGKERVFVVGNGPSLNETDLSLLRDEVTFGVNGIFLKFQETGFKPTLYVVEDHLVAEDRADSINALRGPIKLFPINLAYCLQEDADTIFFDHRPRKRFPIDFDFSTNAAESTYAGCTVTFTCLQLAYYLGFRQIYLIGVDCSYVLPADVEKSKSYAVATLDMKSDDPNHFDPNYFGKGYRWHDPQVDKMQEAYVEAQRVTSMTGTPIYNATVGGQLRAFERREYLSLFEPEHQYPRVLILDISEVGSVTATGQLKSQLLAGWPSDRWMQVYAINRFRVGVRTGEKRDPRSFGARDYDAVLELCEEFKPDVIYCRPVPENRTLLEFTCRLRDSLGLPVVTHVMDDWPMRVGSGGNRAEGGAVNMLREMLVRSHCCLAIGESMAAAFKSRYGVSFRVLANAVESADWESTDESRRDGREFGPDRPFRVKYVGALADNMTFQSVVDTAEAISRINKDLPVAMEIYTMKPWLATARRAVEHFPGVSVSLADGSPEEYRSNLTSADCLLLAYNFDERSVEYTRYSIANKLPELLASGRPILAYGPPDVASMQYAASLDCIEIVNKRDPVALEAALRRLFEDPERCARMGAAGRNIAFVRHNASKARAEFHSVLTAAAGSLGWVPGSAVKAAGDPGIISERPGSLLKAEEMLNLIASRAEKRCGTVWAHAGDERAMTVQEHLRRLGWTTVGVPVERLTTIGDGIRKIVDVRYRDPDRSRELDWARADIAIFAVDRTSLQSHPSTLSKFTGTLILDGFDVWCLEVRRYKSWRRGRRRWRRLVRAPCAVGSGEGEILLLSFADPVHPYDLRRLFGSRYPAEQISEFWRKVVLVGFAMKRGAARWFRTVYSLGR